MWTMLIISIISIMRTTAARAAFLSVLSTALICCAVTCGCRFTLLADAPLLLKDVDLAAEENAASRHALKTVPIELIFVRFNSQADPFHEEFWGLVDEQVLSDGLRHQLNANGLRAGVVSAQLPAHLAQRLVPQATAVKQPSVGDDALPESLFERPAVVRRIVQLLPGRASEVIVAGSVAELVLLEQDGSDVRGGTYHEASAIFSLQAWPAADGRMRLQLSPTIKHGPAERSWIGEDGIFRLQSGQRKSALERLRFEATVPTDSMVVVGCTGEAASTVGDAFFRDRGEQQGDLRLLVIRPLGRSVDPLFAPRESADDAHPFDRDSIAQ